MTTSNQEHGRTTDIGREADYLVRELRCQRQAARALAEALQAGAACAEEATLDEVLTADELLERIAAALEIAAAAGDRHKFLQARAAANLTVFMLQRMQQRCGVESGTA